MVTVDRRGQAVTQIELKSWEKKNQKNVQSVSQTKVDKGKEQKVGSHLEAN